jgi:hypothetical protein
VATHNSPHTILPLPSAGAPPRAAQEIIDELRLIRELLESAQSHAQNRRLQCDPETLSVSLDGRTFALDDPRVFMVFSTIAEAVPRAMTKARIRARNPGQGLNGAKTIPTLLKQLPPELRGILHAGRFGYFIRVPLKKIRGPAHIPPLSNPHSDQFPRQRRASKVLRGGQKSPA